MQPSFSNRLKRVAIKAARPARRKVVRALRHHSARTRALAGKPVDGLRSWFYTFFSALRAHAGARRLSLHALLHRPTAALPAPQRSPSRRPRRMTSSSMGWYRFSA